MSNRGEFKRQSGFIEEKLFKKIITLVPLPCVDIVIISKFGFLLGKRKNKPAQNLWWLIGGRILKGEKLISAVRRKIFEEVGKVKFKIIKQLYAVETIFKDSAQGPSSHTVNVIYLVCINLPRPVISLQKNSDLSELKWFKKINPRWDSYIKKALKTAGF